MIPRTDSRSLAPNMAEQAVNCDLSSGALDGLPTPELVVDLSGYGSTSRRAYRFPDPDSEGGDVWLALPSEFSSVVRSPLKNDTNKRIYWTNPGDAAPHWNTYDRLRAGSANYDVGIVQPSAAPGVSVSGGSGTPLVSRAYCYTYVNQYGEESAPSQPSDVATGAPDGTWHITSLPTTAPANPTGLSYPPVTKLNLYRTVTGTTTGAQFYLVTTFVYDGSPPPSTYTDAAADVSIVNNIVLESANWANPPARLDGLIALPSGMLVGFTGNTIHFCEPNRPHTWPAAYDQSVGYGVVGFGVWQQSLVILTEGFPSTGSGNSPTSFVISTVRVPEPCISRGSIITDLMGVYYASQNGLVMLNYYGMQNQVLSAVTKNQWLSDYHARSIIACRHRAQYLAINGTGLGFIIDYSEARLGFMNLDTFNGAVCVWNDEYTGDAYIMGADSKVYRWDSPSTPSLVFRWRSKQFYLDAPMSMGACMVSLTSEIETMGAVTDTPPLASDDPALVLPDGVNALFRLYVGPEGRNLVMTKYLTKTREIFRLPSGFKAYCWQFELVARTPIHSVKMAATEAELKG